jgi:ADP-ribosyl-[dinitrogen reductase] hydrolase
MVQTALLGGSKKDLKRLADALASEDAVFAYDRKRVESPSGFIADTLRTVFQSLFATDGFEAALIDVVNRGGDSDTTGAILGMVAGALYGPASLPTRWVRHLERDIRHECMVQAQSLIRLSPLCSVGGP